MARTAGDCEDAEEFLAFVRDLEKRDVQWHELALSYYTAKTKLSEALADVSRITALAEARGNELLKLAGERDGEAAARVSMECHLEMSEQCLHALQEKFGAQSRELVGALDRLDAAREALCQIANGIPGACLHATEALQSIAVETSATKKMCAVSGCQWGAMDGFDKCGIHAAL